MVENLNKNQKICPDLTAFEEHEGCLIGSGMIRTIILNPCLKKQCVAYKQGFCCKYKNIIDDDEFKNSKLKGK